VSGIRSSQSVNSSNNITDGGVDYDSGPYNVTFPTGVTTVPFNVSINNDNIYEGDENFTVTIDSSSLPDGVTRGDPGSTTVTIVNDDCKSYYKLKEK